MSQHAETTEAAPLPSDDFESRVAALGDQIDRGVASDDEPSAGLDAVIGGTLYVLLHDLAAAQLMADFSLRYRCDAETFDAPETLLDALGERLPDAVVLGASDPEAGANEVLPELLVAAFGRPAIPVVLVADDEECLTSLEVLTYPVLTFVRRSLGAAGVLAALEPFVPVEHTTGTHETGKELEDKIGLTKAL